MELLSTKDVDRIFSEKLDVRFAAEGFEAISSRRWVGSIRAPIREIFQISPLKGNSFAPAWGVSLDFVPHLSGTSIKAHRTAKSALFDLSYDPLDYTSDVGSWSIDTWQSPSDFAAAVDRLAEKCLPMARSFWAGITSVADLLTAFEEKRTRPFVRFGLDNYPQQSLAFAFTLARAGKRDAAREHLHNLHRSGALPDGCLDALLARLDAAE